MRHSPASRTPPGGSAGAEQSIGERDQREFLAIALVAAIIVYWPAFSAPFYLDDFRIIVENAALHHPFDLAAVWAFSEARVVASLTFAVNYALHGDRVLGYHIVNLVIHGLAGTALFVFARGLLRAPALRARLPAWAHWVPWLALLIYLLHPLQTQAVTYIVQRYTSLMAMFYLATMAAFVWARLRGSLGLYAVAALSLVLALFTKQTAATLPLALLLIELLFFRHLSLKQRLLTVAIAVAAACIGAWLVTLSGLDVHGLTRETDKISRVDYLATQMEVLWRYIGLLFGIGEQRLEYSIDVTRGFAHWATIAMALGHALVLAAGVALWRRAPLIAFGILFYYLAHLVESSFFPIIDVAFEHRTYLPNAGASMAGAVGLAWLATRRIRFRTGALAVLAIFLALGTLTFARNALWADRIGFLTHEARLAPHSQRAWTSLGKELMRAGEFAPALTALKRARRIAMETDDGYLRPPTLINLVFAEHYNGNHREAIELANTLSPRDLDRSNRAFYLEARGRAYLALDQVARAKADLDRAARLNPSANIVAYLADAELRLGHRSRARRLADSVLDASPNHPLALKVMRRSNKR